MAPQRWTAKVDRGLSNIYAHLQNELQMSQLSELECRCEGCQVNGPCLCPEDYRRQCDECRNASDWADAIEWLGRQLEKHDRSKP